MDRKIYITYGQDGKRMAGDLLAGAKIRVPQGSAIAIKPNLVVARPANEGATTHPEVIEGIIEYLLDFGHKDIIIMESAWIGDSTVSAFRNCGYEKLAKRYSIPLLDLKQDSAVSVDTPIGKLQVCRSALAVQYMINVPVLKGHCQTAMTCALKNLKGLIPDSEKRRFHTMGLHKPIAALSSVFRPALTIVDSLCGDLNFEEGGHPVATQRMLLGKDPVQIDAYGCGLMGISPSEVAYIGLAERYGTGSAAWREEDIVQQGTPGSAKAHLANGGIVGRLKKNVQEDQACSACYGNLIHALARLDEQGQLRKAPSLSIGQGFQGKRGEGLGIGKCCAAFDQCVPGCPPTAAAILDKMMGRFRA